MPNVKICFFSGDISRTGGTERVTTLIANALANRGFDVFILSVRGGNRASFFTEANVQLYSLCMDQFSANLSDLRVIKRLRSFIIKNNIDYIVDVDVILSYYSVLASIFSKTKVVSWEHFYYYINLGDFGQKIRRKIARLFILRFTHSIVVLTEKDQKNYLNKYYNKLKVVTINNPITSVGDKRSDLINKSVVAVGRLVHEKGFDLLIKAWGLVHQKRPDWVLHIVGSGVDYDLLRKMVACLGLEKSITFIANTENVEKFYLDASIYAMTSRFEGFGMVLLEAKSYGLPIVSFDSDCGPGEIVKHNYDGYLVKFGDINTLAICLLELMNDEEKRINFGKRARLDNRFELQRIIRQWENIFIPNEY
jgi:glycosyltransferase involved in cell wall biosynthesis